MIYSLANEWGVWVIYWSRIRKQNQRAVNGRKIVDRSAAVKFAKKHGLQRYRVLYGSRSKYVSIDNLYAEEEGA